MYTITKIDGMFYPYRVYRGDLERLFPWPQPLGVFETLEQANKYITEAGNAKH